MMRVEAITKIIFEILDTEKHYNYYALLFILDTLKYIIIPSCMLCEIIMSNISCKNKSSS